MNAQKSDYLNSFQNLANSHQVSSTKAEIGSVTDDKLEVARTFTNEFGNALIGSVGIESLGKLGKIGQFAKMSKVEKIKALRAKALKAVTPKKATAPDGDEDGDVFEDAQEPAQEPAPQRDPDFTNEEFETREPFGDDGFLNADRDPEGTDSDFFSQMGGRAPQNDMPQQTTEEPAVETDQSVNVAQEGQEQSQAISDVSRASKIESDVTAGLEEGTVDSLADDESPVGLAITATLGVATLMAGMFIHPTKPKVITPAQTTIPNNFSVQQGTN